MTELKSFQGFILSFSRFQLQVKTTSTFTPISYSIIPSDTIIVFAQCIFKDGLRLDGTIACREKLFDLHNLEKLSMSDSWATEVYGADDKSNFAHLRYKIFFSRCIIGSVKNHKINSFLNEVRAWVFGKLLFCNYRSALFIVLREQCNMAWIKRIRRIFFFCNAERKNLSHENDSKSLVCLSEGMRDARLPARQKLNISDDYEIHEK